MASWRGGALRGHDSVAQGWRATARPAIGGGHFGSCRSVEDFELLACIGEGTYGETFCPARRFGARFWGTPVNASLLALVSLVACLPWDV